MGKLRFFLPLLLGLHAACWSLEVRFEPVADSVYAFVGDTSSRTIDNQAHNANIGLIVTPEGAVLIDSGATASSARLIERAVRRVTSQPVRWVINTGGQDHRWLGNAYFRSQGAQLIAHSDAMPDMRARGGDQLAALQSLLGADVADTTAALPGRLVDSSVMRLTLGGTPVELHHRGGGHTPGDLMVWLPLQRTLFSGDIVYVDRLLAVLPVSNTRAWLASFEAIKQLSPQRIVPGHGQVTELAAAREQTLDVLVALRAHMKRAVAQGLDIGVAVRSFDSRPFLHLRNASELMRGNANRVYLEMERE